MVVGDKFCRITDSTAKLDRLKRIGIVKGNEIGDDVGSDGFQPKMEWQIAGIEGAAGVH